MHRLKNHVKLRLSSRYIQTLLSSQAKQRYCHVRMTPATHVLRRICGSLVIYCFEGCCYVQNHNKNSAWSINRLRLIIVKAWSVGCLVHPEYAILIQEDLQLSRDEAKWPKWPPTGIRLDGVGWKCDYG